MNVSLLKEKLKELEAQSYPRKIKYNPSRYFESYDSCQVERLLWRFLDSKGICREWSEKRKGWIIKCPGESTHEHRPRRDDCTIYSTKKDNGFMWISGRCRHTSCGESIMAFCRDLNKEWGMYLNSNYSP